MSILYNFVFYFHNNFKKNIVILGIYSLYNVWIFYFYKLPTSNIMKVIKLIKYNHLFSHKWKQSDLFIEWGLSQNQSPVCCYSFHSDTLLMGVDMSRQFY